MFAFTEFGLQVFREFKAANEEGYGDRYLQAVALQYLAQTAPAQPPAAEPAAVTVEVGNHTIVLSQPQLPQTYSLESLRQSEVVAFDDPLAIAAQFLEAADLVTAQMQQDLQARQAAIQRTQQAKEAIDQKALELKIQSKLYREQTAMANAVHTAETQGLQQSLATLQGSMSPF